MEKKNEKKQEEKVDFVKKGEEVVNDPGFIAEAKKWGIILGCIVGGILLGCGGSMVVQRAKANDEGEDNPEA